MYAASGTMGWTLTTEANVQIEIRGQNFWVTPALRESVQREITAALRRFGHRVGWVAVHLSDLNGRKGGPDKRCGITLHLSRRKSVQVEDTDVDLYLAIRRSAQRARRMLGHELGRTRSLTGRARKYPAAAAFDPERVAPPALKHFYRAA
jgi:putative sigma-54 modulation protein